MKKAQTIENVNQQGEKMEIPEVSSVNLTVELESVLDSVDHSPQRLFEIAETFRQDAPKFLGELKASAYEGRQEDAIQAGTKLNEVSRLVNATPLFELSIQAIQLARQNSWTELLQMSKTLETAIQGAIDLLRQECVLKDTVRLPEPVIKD